ncbi:response regulator transcription factor [Actinoplanes regularis]|uniref:DNA-binding response regulator, NarL/FixJ family, contains REC and HTH domains n=1 Tax=Actinoplanes regularis TaxID=52697 RepID=A0A239E2X8_9ACTN|nr:response regulator transcription factor [Actinoplanes regularis]GIE88884.1 hypothetical protein Are01nite_53640 [Actinoplanes regularis]SNS38638.1 DNA-binding response regulator, NarL/FixJ family, contains REC and HTH domains [Actinoplanes regularis]
MPGVAIEVAVVDPLPLFRQGAAAVLTAAGHTVHTPSDVLAWASRTPGALILLTVLTSEDWSRLARLHESSHLVVALLNGESTAAGVRAVRSGARSVLLRDASPAALRRTVSATIDGQAVVPARVAAALAGGSGDDRESTGRPAEAKMAWLRALAGGVTVAELAVHAGYSERAMFRMLRALYREMGVSTRVAALIRAQESGWLRPGG